VVLEKLDAQQKLTANQWKIAFAATIGDMLDFFDFGLIAFVLAFIVKDWHLTFGESGLILLASGISAPFGSLLWGWAADKIGRRKAMIGAVLNTSIATGAMALTPEHAWIYLVICRLFVGFGVTGMYSVDITIIPLRQGVKWHDGKPFTAADVKCTVDLLMGSAKVKLRINPRKSWFANVAEVTTNGDYEATFHLKRPQPSFLALLATGWSPIYPCHVSPRDMRTHPIGTGPFKFVEFQPNERITVTRNVDYWKKGRPYLDGIEYTIIKDVSTRLLSFIAGKDDVYFGVTIPQLRDVKKEAPQAICQVVAANVARNLIVNRNAPPFDNPDLRRAMSLSLDRKSFIDILTEGQGDIGGVMQPPPSGLWGMPQDLIRTLPGYDPDVRKRRDDARALMQKLGYGPDKRLAGRSRRATSPPTAIRP
jgi:Bacterial extracellular solute-binding proteins, family 5 Middle/Major Facilitator Superfamily